MGSEKEPKKGQRGEGKESRYICVQTDNYYTMELRKMQTVD